MRLVVVAVASNCVPERAQQPQDESKYQHDHSSDQSTGTLTSKPVIINAMPKRIMTFCFSRRSLVALLVEQRFVPRGVHGFTVQRLRR